MVRIFHSRYGDPTPLKGQPYIGSYRQLLSEWLGGKVGFAYAHFPEQWHNSLGIIEIWLPTDLPVVLSLNGEPIPRKDYSDVSFLDFLAGESIGKYFCGFAGELSGFLPISRLGELAFLADGRAVFGKLINKTTPC